MMLLGDAGIVLFSSFKFSLSFHWTREGVEPNEITSIQNVYGIDRPLRRLGGRPSGSRVCSGAIVVEVIAQNSLEVEGKVNNTS